MKNSVVVVNESEQKEFESKCNKLVEDGYSDHNLNELWKSWIILIEEDQC